MDESTRHLTEANGAFTGIAQSLIGQGELTRQFAAARALAVRWTDRLGETITLRQGIQARQTRVQQIGQSATVVSTIAIFGVGAVLVIHGSLDSVMLIGANILASRAIGAMNRLLGTVDVMTRAARARSDIDAVCSLPRETEGGRDLPHFEGRLELADIAFQYPNTFSPVFEHLQASVPVGGMCLVRGPNGAGKTTLARLLTGLRSPDRGAVLVDGVDLRQIRPDWWREQLVYLPQEPVFFDGSLRENLTVLNPQATDQEILERCDRLVLSPFLDHQPKGLDMPVVGGGSALPLGIRRRLALVRGLLTCGQIVVLDDPTEGIDTAGCQAIAQVLNDDLRARGATMIILSNDQALLRAAQVVIDLGTKPVPRVVERTPELETAATAPTEPSGLIDTRPSGDGS